MGIFVHLSQLVTLVTHGFSLQSEVGVPDAFPLHAGLRIEIRRVKQRSLHICQTLSLKELSVLAVFLVRNHTDFLFINHRMFVLVFILFHPLLPAGSHI